MTDIFDHTKILADQVSGDTDKIDEVLNTMKKALLEDHEVMGYVLLAARFPKPEGGKLWARGIVDYMVDQDPKNLEYTLMAWATAFLSQDRAIAIQLAVFILHCVAKQSQAAYEELMKGGPPIGGVQ